METNIGINDPTKLDANTWYHIALVYDNADETLKIYVDGKLTNSGFYHDWNFWFS